MTTIEATAPTRIDLAGGTLDIPPLDLLVPAASTLNIAIDLRARARVEPRPAGFAVESADRDRRRSFATLQELRADRDLPLLTTLLAELAPEGGVTLRTDCASPAGAGLGGSSALAVAVAAALLHRRRGEAPSHGRLLAVARDAETRVLRVPTGIQDYTAALGGGARELVFGVGGPREQPVPVHLEALRERTVLVYSGVPRSSGINNWQVTRAFLDGDLGVRRALEGIATQARRAREALRAGDLDALAEAVAGEWSLRRRLAPGVSTPAIDGLMEAARVAGALGGKACGAGGGGCVLLLTRSGSREAVEQAARHLGMEVLGFRFDSQGLGVRELS